MPSSGMVTDGVPLLDHHCHGVVTADLARPEFEALLTEAGTAHPGRSAFDSMLGAAVLRWCAPILDLPAHPEPERYLTRRAELGWREVSSRLLRAGGVRTWLVDTGFTSVELTGVPELAELGGGTAYEVLRLEPVFEQVAAGGVAVAGLAAAVRDALRRQTAPSSVVGLKSIAAYRCGLAIPATQPSTKDFEAAADSWMRGGAGRLADPVLIGWLVHEGARLSAELGLPLQLHTGFGDADLSLRDADPLLLGDFLAATRDSGAVIMLLHCWPYHRNAGYLAHVHPHVRADVGLAVPYVGDRAGAVLAELLELAPFAAVCFSSDAYGLPELHYLGAALWRRGLGQLADQWLADDVMPVAAVERLVSAMAYGNAAGDYVRCGADGSRSTAAR